MSDEKRDAKKLEKVTDAAVVADMQRFFHEHGFYRAEDVHRIMGDPSKGITVTTSSDLVFSKSEK